MKTTTPPTAHTPGPWKQSVQFEKNYQIVACDGNVCRLSHTIGTKEYQANAHLIAAAPELLEMLEDLLHDANEVISQELIYDTSSWFHSLESWAIIANNLQSLVDKAKGETI